MTPQFAILLIFSAIANVISCRVELEAVQMARSEILHALYWAKSLKKLHDEFDLGSSNASVALDDCVKLYESSEPRLGRLVSGHHFSDDDALTWLTAALASNRGCLDALAEKGLYFKTKGAQNLKMLLEKALISIREQGNKRGRCNGVSITQSSNKNWGLLASWDAENSKFNLVVDQEGLGDYLTINQAVAALAAMGTNRPERAVVYVKSGVYKEQVHIERELTNVMFVGDGIDRTIVTGNRNVLDGATTLSSATFAVDGDGFWARDMTFENTAGPQKHQAVAMSAHSDKSIFYRCSFKGYQDTLLVYQLRQFYRDCQIYGTIDFIFGNAAAVFQNCNIFVRRPMDSQDNVITAQGRDSPNGISGISIINSKVLPAPDFVPVKGMFKSYLGRPWGKYARVVFIKTELDDLVAPEGWEDYHGNLALPTLYFAECMNIGNGADVTKRVKFQGLHVVRSLKDVNAFSVRNFIQGQDWIPAAGFPFSLDL